MKEQKLINFCSRVWTPSVN